MSTFPLVDREFAKSLNISWAKSETEYMATNSDTTKYPFNAKDIAALRDEQLLSWAKVASGLGLGSPGAARRAYSALVRPHTDSVLPGHTFGGGVTPVDLTNATLAQVRDAIVGHTIVVQRAKGTEDIAVAKVTSVKGGTVNLHDGDKSRAVKAGAVIATK